jgi:hypothetical protein
MPQVAFEPTISVLEREKTVHALDRATTVIGHAAIIALLNKQGYWEEYGVYTFWI